MPGRTTLADEISTLTAAIDPSNPDCFLEWPPDMFALTSYLLKRTGAYRFTVDPECSAAQLQKGTRIEADAKTWLAQLFRSDNAAPTPIEEVWKKLKSNAESVSVDELQHSDRWICDECPARSACESIMYLHAVADQASRAAGIPTGGMEDSNTASLALLENLLLSTYGSLSRLPKHIGIVLPKLRTPQTGLSIRSFSHHLSYHETELNVVWRAIPWVNTIERGLNLMLLPWPPTFSSSRFKPTPATRTGARGERDRYFKYESNERLDPEAVRELITAAEQEVDRIHMILLPELALTSRELSELETYLSNSAKESETRIPIILTGVRDADGERQGDSVSNHLVLSMHFAEQWYHLEQNKHHRWKLDSSQLKQYRLGGVLSASKSWWESLAVARRRVSFIVPNGWLAIAPLICEDLAQLEPTAEVLRGVGPTLVAALLLDGPQLAERWSARYATVLADDPGSSVVTLTSLGIARRSIARQPQRTRDCGTIGLWKDQESGLHELKVSKNAQNDDRTAVILTASAAMRQEFTADLRGDGGHASVLVLQHKCNVNAKRSLSLESRDPVVQDDAYHPFRPSDKYDVQELTRLTYLVHAVLVDPSILSRAKSWITSKPDAAGTPLKAAKSVLSIIGQRIGESDRESEARGGAIRPGGRQQEVPFALNVLLRILKSAVSTEPGGELNHRRMWEKVTDHCLVELSGLAETTVPEDGPIKVSDARRLTLLCILSVLSGIHEKLVLFRDYQDLRASDEDLMIRVEDALQRRYLGKVDGPRKKARHAAK